MDIDAEMTSVESQHALVTATFSQRMRLRLDDGAVVNARIKGKKLRPVCGDRVETQAIPNEPEWLITDVRPRKNELARPDRRGKTEVLAANFDLIAVITSDVPATDWFIVDRYLAAAELIDVSALIVFNKSDLGATSTVSATELSEYEKTGYSIVVCSAKDGKNLGELRQRLRNQTSIIVGQSGVGKSSLINALVEDADQQTARLSQSTGEGRHTTVNSVLWSLPDGGAVIDSPGVRDYAPAIASPARVASGFREIARLARDCRFADCRHMQEPDCAVKQGVEKSAISARRYESYRRLRKLSEDLA